MTAKTLEEEFNDPAFVTWARSAPIGDRIRWLIEVRELKQTEVADRMGITQAAISNWITGSSRKPSSPSLVRLADVLGSNPTWIIYGEGTPFSQKPPAVVLGHRKTSKLPQKASSAQKPAGRAKAPALAPRMGSTQLENSGKETREKKTSEKAIGGMELRLVRAFRAMSPDAKVAILAVAAALAETP